MSTLNGNDTLAGFVDQRCSDKSCQGKNAYRMVGGCYNCGNKPLLGMFTTGHQHHNGGDCPACGASRLHWDRLATPDEIPAAAGDAS